MALDIVDITGRHKANLHSFLLDPDAWRTFSASHALPWTKIRFSRSNKAQIPRRRGIYAFTVEHTPSLFPAHGYVMYVGISGDRSGANLRLRYFAYLKDQAKDGGRPAVTYMLRRFRDDLYFSFCELPDPSIDLKALESALLAAIVPPINQSDLPARILRARKASF